MLALLDLGLFVLSPEAWAQDRERCVGPMMAMATHQRFLRPYPIRVIWSEDFFSGFPWNQPRCPQALRDACVAVKETIDYLRANGRLLPPEELGQAPSTLPTLTPDLMADEHAHPDELRLVWFDLLGAFVCDAELSKRALAVPTWERPLLAKQKTLRITNAAELAALVSEAALLVSEDDWCAFVEQHHKPDLSGRRVAVLGGNRAPFERAKETLATYGLTDMRRLPPAYEESRTKQDTEQRLANVELLIVCTNRCKHTDTDQVKGFARDKRVDLNNDTEARIVEAIVDYFRAQGTE